MSSYQSITCLTRTGMSYEYEYIITYHVPVTRCVVVVVVIVSLFSLRSYL